VQHQVAFSDQGIRQASVAAPGLQAVLTEKVSGRCLKNLAVAPQARGQGVGQALVHPPKPLGFQSCGQLADGSTAMLVFQVQAASGVISFSPGKACR